MIPIINQRPPMWDRIIAVFNVVGKPVIFAWGDRIYNPEGGSITPALMAHEAVHCARQQPDVIAWWERYLAEPAFRLDEEMPAHFAELETLCRENPARPARRMYLHQCAARLASPLYGRLVTYDRARNLLKPAAARC